MSKENTIEVKRRIDLILSGHTNEYAWFVNSYSQQVMEFLSRLVRESEPAQEIAQDVFVKAYRSLSSYKVDCSFLTWLLRIAHNEAMNRLKRKKPVQIDVAELPLVDESQLSTGKEERIKMMEEAIHLLPDDEQLLLHLYYYEDIPLKEISYIMDVEANVLATRLHRIRKKLLSMIKQKENEQTERYRFA